MEIVQNAREGLGMGETMEVAMPSTKSLMYTNGVASMFFVAAALTVRALTPYVVPKDKDGKVAIPLGKMVVTGTL